MSMQSPQTCCGFIPLNTAVLLITIFGILNKLSGFYGIISLDFGDPIVSAVYVYSLLGVFVGAYALYGLHKQNLSIVRWYTIYYWMDCMISTATTIWFATDWYLFTDHRLPDLSPEEQLEHDHVFKMESIVSLTFLVVLRLIHVYFALVVTSYYQSMGHGYARLSKEQDFE
ncbi:Inositolphosphorylceramide synthase subunit Kei1-domain-containing protein [Gongronella butleri]|nr:Inositolphosphorylceramide synthase subunit Kei1-domain-containing protein [Gongronella butleri]